MKESKNALIIGASRGLGLALVNEYLRRGWQVTATVRSSKPGGLHDLAGKSTGRLKIENLDVLHTDQISALKSRLQGQSFDFLFVNAGVTNDPKENIGQVSTENFIRLMLTNALSPLRVIESVADQVKNNGTIGVMSSGLGSIADNESGGYEVYRASKAALNMLMRSYAARTKSTSARTILVIAPGWIRTDMGGPQATYTVEESIPRIVDTILAQEGKSGIQYLNQFGESVRW